MVYEKYLHTSYNIRKRAYANILTSRTAAYTAIKTCKSRNGINLMTTYTW